MELRIIHSEARHKISQDAQKYNFVFNTVKFCGGFCKIPQAQISCKLVTRTRSKTNDCLSQY